MHQPLRSVAGHQARILRECLVERMGRATSAECSRIRKALQLCDKFLNTRQGTQQDLDRLEKQVTTVLLPPEVKVEARAKSVPQAKPEVPGPSACSLPGINDRQVTECMLVGSSFSTSADVQPGGASVDLSMPCHIRLDRQAHARSIGFADVARAQDRISSKDDELRARNKAAHRARTRSLLDGQMKEIAARKEREAQEAAEEARKMEEDIANHQAQQEAEAIAARQAQEKMRHQLTNQVEEIYRARYTMHQEAMRAANLERQQAEADAREEAAAVRRKKEEHMQANKKFSREMLAALDEKKERIAREQEEERLYVLKCKKRMDDEQQAREAAVTARKEKLDAAFKRGGGEALAVGLEVRAREDERRAAEQQAAYESKATALQEQRQADKRNKTQQQVETLKEQIAEKQRRAQQELDEKRRCGQLAVEEARTRRQLEKEAKAYRKLAQAKELQHLKEQFLEQQKTRYQFAKDNIAPADMWLHKQVADGTKRGFTTLKSVLPSV